MFNLNSKIDPSFVLQKHTYYDKLQLLPHTSKTEKNQSVRNKVKEPLNKVTNITFNYSCSMICKVK